MLLFLRISAFITLAFVFHSTEKENEDWTLVRNNDKVKIFTRTTSESQFKEVLVLTEVESSLSGIVALLKDVERYPEWIYACEKAHVVKTVSPTHEFYYQETDAPWPVSNRDIIMDSKLTQNEDGSLVSKSVGRPDIIPLMPGIVRVKNIDTKWTFTPKSEKLVLIRYELAVDPGGTLPPWLVNLTVDVGPYHTILKMRELLKEEKYQSKKLDFIKEFGD